MTKNAIANPTTEPTVTIVTASRRTDARDIGAGGADGQSDADFLRSARDRAGHHAVKANGRQHKGEESNRSEKHGTDLTWKERDPDTRIQGGDFGARAGLDAAQRVAHRIEVQRRRGRRPKHELQPAPVVRDLRERLVKLRPIVLTHRHGLGALDDPDDAKELRVRAPEKRAADGRTRAEISAHERAVDDGDAVAASIGRIEASTLEHGNAHNLEEIGRHGVPVEVHVHLLPMSENVIVLPNCVMSMNGTMRAAARPRYRAEPEAPTACDPHTR